MGTAQGFWSYVHKDNEGMHGAIVRVAEHVQDEYGVITGGLELDLFLDSMSLKWGEKWRVQVREAIENSTFFIPIVTPRYFKSEECRNELLGFAEQAKELGREALIMPLYFVEVPALERGDFNDPMVKLVADSQMKDWRNLRFLDETTQPYRLALGDLASRLLEVSRERESITPAQPRSRDDEEEEGQPQALPESRGNSHAEPAPGALDQLVEGEEAFPRLVETLEAISSEIAKIGELAAEATEEMTESDTKGGGFKGRLAVANRLAHKLSGQADCLEQLTSEYRADLFIVDPAIRQMLQLAANQPDANPGEVDEFFSSIGGMVDSAEEATKEIRGMMDSLDQTANLSRELDAPLNRLRVSLQSMIDGYEVMEIWRKDMHDLAQS